MGAVTLIIHDPRRPAWVLVRHEDLEAVDAAELLVIYAAMGYDPEQIEVHQSGEGEQAA